MTRLTRDVAKCDADTVERWVLYMVSVTIPGFQFLFFLAHSLRVEHFASVLPEAGAPGPNLAHHMVRFGLTDVSSERKNKLIKKIYVR